MFKLLIVEDDIKLRQLFERVLVKNGYSVKGASNGKEGLSAINAEYFDLIISDVMMPIMDGYEFVRELRNTGNNTPVLMITAKSEFDDMRLGFLCGTDDYMVKPINVNEISDNSLIYLIIHFIFSLNIFFYKLMIYHTFYLSDIHLFIIFKC